MDVIYFAVAQKVGNVLINQRKILQVQNEAAIAGFFAELRFEFAYAISAHSTCEIEGQSFVSGPREKSFTLWTQSQRLLWQSLWRSLAEPWAKR